MTPSPALSLDARAVLDRLVLASPAGVDQYDLGRMFESPTGHQLRGRWALDILADRGFAARVGNDWFVTERGLSA